MYTYTIYYVYNYIDILCISQSKRGLAHAVILAVSDCTKCDIQTDRFFGVG